MFDVRWPDMPGCHTPDSHTALPTTFSHMPGCHTSDSQAFDLRPLQHAYSEADVEDYVEDDVKDHVMTATTMATQEPAQCTATIPPARQVHA